MGSKDESQRILRQLKAEVLEATSKAIKSDKFGKEDQLQKEEGYIPESRRKLMMSQKIQEY